uniref:Uncharacterized protein n=1 Tax=Felis catus TaxID=9685 RepID=A0ABI7X3W7_FELCA
MLCNLSRNTEESNETAKLSENQVLARMWRSRDPRALLAGTQTSAAAVENGTQVPSNVNTELPRGPAIPLLGVHPKEQKAGPRRNTCTRGCMAVLPTVPKTWKQSKRPPTVNKMWSTHTMGYYPALTRREIRPRATTWMSHEDVVLSETSQSRKDKHRLTPLT